MTPIKPYLAVLIVSVTLLTAIALVFIYSEAPSSSSSLGAIVLNSSPAPYSRSSPAFVPGQAVPPDENDTPRQAPAPLADTTPPSIPQGLTAIIGAVSNGATAVSLSWNASTDDQNSVGYFVYVRNVTIGVKPSPIHLIDIGNVLSYPTRFYPGTYVFGVVAYDTSPAMNQSEPSTIVVTILPVLTINKPTHGSIISADGFISCGLLGNACSHAYQFRTSVTLSVVPEAGYQLLAPTPQVPNSGWSGACSIYNAPQLVSPCIFTMNQDRVAGATFSRVLDPSFPPGKNFDLSHWKITVPNPADTTTGQKDIVQPTLATYSDPYFYTDAGDSSMTFWLDSSLQGHTLNSDNIRSELRERWNTSSDNDNWSIFGTHTLMADLKLDCGASNTIPNEITVMQIHAKENQPGDTSSYPLLRIRYLAGSTSGGSIAAKVTDFSYSPTPTRTYRNIVLKSGANCLRHTIQIKIQPVGAVIQMSAIVDGGAQIILAADLNKTWCMSATQCFTNYFKAGDYAQANTGISEIHFYDLTSAHQ